jgi:hydrogenase maturation protease
MGDDGAGIHIINELKRRNLPENADVIDGGVAGVDLIDILSSYNRVIVVDAIMDKGVRPPDIRVFSADDIIYRRDDCDYSVHDMELTSVLSLMKTLEMDMPDLRIIGIPAVSTAPGIGLSEECSKLIPAALGLIVKITTEGCHSGC